VLKYVSGTRVILHHGQKRRVVYGARDAGHLGLVVDQNVYNQNSACLLCDRDRLLRERQSNRECIPKLWDVHASKLPCAGLGSVQEPED
jgi:hypothetical protein